MSKKVTNAKIIAAMTKADGMIPDAARDLGLTRQGLHQRINGSPALQAAIREIDAEIKDVAEGEIRKAIRAGDGQMARWYADRQMRDRGYGSRVEVSVAPGVIEGLADAIALGGAAAVRAAIAAFEGRR